VINRSDDSGIPGRDCQSARELPALFWYSQHTAVCFLAALVLVVIAVSYLTPPFQAPDEFNHVKRAYLLSEGKVYLGAVNGVTGGDIDSGLLAYMACFEKFPARYEEKMSQRIARTSDRAKWTGEKKFSELPNTAVYFPFAYAPQAAAFVIGRHSGLSISTTYILARALSLATAIALLWFALVLYPVPLPVLALFCMPSVIFQFGTTSLYATSYAMCVLAICLFMRAGDRQFSFNGLMHFALILSLFLLATSRANLLGLTWLPAVLYWIRRSRWYLASAGTLLLLSVSWVAFAALTVKGIETLGISPVGVLFYYLTHIGSFFSVIFSTITNRAILLGNWNMFVGILGWQDTPLDAKIYLAFAFLLGAAGIVSLQVHRDILLERTHISLAIAAVLSTLLLLVLLLTTYTFHPAKVVDAIRGRYLFPMAIALGFALFDREMSLRRKKIGVSILFLMMVLSVVSATPKLIARYWTS